MRCGCANLFLSPVTLYELYVGAPTEGKRLHVKLITEDITVLPFTEEVAEKAAQIYHQLKRSNSLIEFRDIFIAVTCLVFNQQTIKSILKE